MKELSIEEKAKAYDDAIERAKKVHNEQKAQPFDVMLKIFPELKESEDERIRKEIIEHIILLKSATLSDLRDKQFDSWIAWLEKQGEQIDIANKEYWRGYREGKQEILDKYAEIDKQGEQKPAWSEDDELKRNTLIHVVKKQQGSAIFEGLLPEELIDWLKSLKGRYTWKPSDEQMEVLLSEVTAWTKGCPKQKVLESLYNDLKKLRKE